MRRLISLILFFSMISCASTTPTIQWDGSKNPERGYIELNRDLFGSGNFVSFLVMDSGDVIEKNNVVEKTYLLRFNLIARQLVLIKFKDGVEIRVRTNDNVKFVMDDEHKDIRLRVKTNENIVLKDGTEIKLHTHANNNIKFKNNILIDIEKHGDYIYFSSKNIDVAKALTLSFHDYFNSYDNILFGDVVKVKESELNKFLDEFGLTILDMFPLTSYLIKGSEIGNIGPVGQLKWARKPGEFRLIIKNSDEHMRVYRSRLFEVKKGETLKINMKATVSGLKFNVAE